MSVILFFLLIFAAMIKKLFVTTLLLSLCIFILAQNSQPRDEIKEDPRKSASNSLAYPGPTGTLTPAPAGKKAFYLSHYGRHGSRYMTKIRDYDYCVDILQKAKKNNKLTLLGEDVLGRLKLMQREVDDRWGDMTSLGITQLKDIATRMWKNYPEVFDGKAHVDARSTLVPRCVLSMAHFIQQLTALNPKLDIALDATHHDMYYLNFQDKVLFGKGNSEKTRKVYNEYCRRHACWQRMVSTLFNDSVYVHREVNGERLNYYLFRLAGNLQNSDLRNQITLFDIYTPEELYENWRMENVFWFLGYGYSSLNEGQQPFTQRHLLRKMIEQADSCIQLPKPGAQLRFGHETMVLPLTCLMGLNGYDAMIDDLEQLEQKGWVNYRVYPMGCNIQLIFYRKNIKDKDVLVKVLLNENEARLPIATDMAPYYHWNDVRDYYLKLLDTYNEE